jgi:hypothetical protein
LFDPTNGCWRGGIGTASPPNPRPYSPTPPHNQHIMLAGRALVRLWPQGSTATRPALANFNSNAHTSEAGTPCVFSCVVAATHTHTRTRTGRQRLRPRPPSAPAAPRPIDQCERSPQSHRRSRCLGFRRMAWGLELRRWWLVGKTGREQNDHRNKGACVCGTPSQEPGWLAVRVLCGLKGRL